MSISAEGTSATTTKPPNAGHATARVHAGRAIPATDTASSTTSSSM
jgi:hypothetical protein